eukprot:CAMPEP_0202724956 /NCGR_PEP_ID=MMETSP1385-20130828/178101_1 /ASSEMBLY_ACC=CAM_ASM_000861 /TAXON_ID=933848 /ORGANISM="Elphidium margaritaceum" /LENGTH=70 /DNA_ID=CAMNT_0049390785 /DNA_START=207 /DNA_END=419 /DNA_ORIENTATION=-
MVTAITADCAVSPEGIEGVLEAIKNSDICVSVVFLTGIGLFRFATRLNPSFTKNVSIILMAYKGDRNNML